MTAVVLYDDARARAFEPFALSRPLGEVRAGALLIRERWERALGLRCAGFLGAPHLEDFAEFEAPPYAGRGVLAAGTLVVHARCAPALAPIGAADAVTVEGRLAAVRLAAPVEAARFDSGALALEDVARDGGAEVSARGTWLDAPWDLVRALAPMLADDLLVLGPATGVGDASSATILGDHPVWIAPSAQVEPLVVLDASAGPIVIDAGARVAAFTRLAGPCYVGRDAQVLGGRVSTCAIGEQCRVHGEVSHCAFIGHANKGHDGFVGHSVLGRWANLGAATVTSNLKNTYGSVHLWTPQGIADTGLQFLGTLLGDHARTGIGTRLTTGSVVGMGANVVADGVAPKVVSPFTWRDGVTYDPARFATVAARVMARRGVTLSDAGRRYLQRTFDARWSAPA